MHYMYFAMLSFWMSGIVAGIVSLATPPGKEYLVIHYYIKYCILHFGGLYCVIGFRLVRIVVAAE